MTHAALFHFSLGQALHPPTQNTQRDCPRLIPFIMTTVHNWLIQTQFYHEDTTIEGMIDSK